MAIKAIVVSYFALLLVLTLFTILSNYIDIVIYIDKLPLMREDVFVITDTSSNLVYITKYIVYGVEIRDQYLCKYYLRIDHYISNYIVNEIGIKNIVIETGLSNSTPVVVPKTILSSEEYRVLVKEKYGLKQIHIGLSNVSAKTSIRYAEYLLVVTIYIVNSSKYIDIAKHIPPIIYYPRGLVLNTTLAKLVEYSINDTMNQSILKYFINTVLNEYSFVDGSIEYIVYSSGIKYSYLTLSWIFLIILVEYEKPGVSIVYSKKLFYKLIFSLSYILRKSRALKRYIRELSRI